MLISGCSADKVEMFEEVCLRGYLFGDGLDEYFLLDRWCLRC